MKKKLLVVILFCLSIAGMSLARQARETINVDLNVQNDANAYNGKGAYDTNGALYNDGINTWQVFYPNKQVRSTSIPGWGIPIGSPRSAHLSDSNDPNNPAIYSRQVWIGDNGVGRTAYRDSGSAIPTLMNDGFRKTAGEPNLFFWGKDAYQGTYDIYVYGNEDGNFSRVKYNPQTATWDPCTKHVAGGVPAGQFSEGGNYIVFPEVNIVDANCVLKTLFVDGVPIGIGGNAQTLSYVDEVGNAGTGRMLSIGGDANANPRVQDLPNHPPNFHAVNTGFNGEIDEFAIYSGVLSDACIAAHYAAAAADYNAAVMRDHPLLYYRFEDTSSAYNAVATNKGSLGTTYNGRYVYNYSGFTGGDAGLITLVPGYDGNCASFYQGIDSNDAFVNIRETTRALELENITIECWVRTTQQTGSPRICNRNTAGGQRSYGLTYINQQPLDVNAVGMIGGGNTSFVDVNNPNPIYDGAWHHIAATYRSVPGGMFIGYSNVINGLQLVSTKRAKVMGSRAPADFDPTVPRTRIAAGQYDVAGERSGRVNTPQTTVYFGPGVNSGGDANYARPQTTRIDRKEYMEYDIFVDDANAGKYRITADVSPAADGMCIIGFYLDDVNLGVQTRSYNSNPALNAGPTTPVDVNITPGYHTFKWMHTGYDSSSTGYSVLDINFVRLNDQTDPCYTTQVASDCNGVKRYGLLYEGDLNKDCKVDNKDLDMFTDSWLECSDPNWKNCQ